MKFRKKPVVIEATQWFKDGDHPAVKVWSKGGHVYPNGTPLVDTLEGELRVSPGDWIITGVKGEHYPCKPDIFAATYEPAEAVTAAESSAGGLSFGAALTALKTGQRVARAGWNGKGMFAYLVPANAYPAQTGAAKAFFGDGGMVPYNAYLALKGADDTVSTWAPSGSDALAEDWYVIDVPATRLQDGGEAKAGALAGM